MRRLIIAFLTGEIYHRGMQKSVRMAVCTMLAVGLLGLGCGGGSGLGVDNDNANDNANTNANTNDNGNNNTAEICDNNLDDDGNGQIDCADTACAAAPECNPEICDNTIDDDGNGQADCDDAACANAPNCQVAEDCTNGTDDDGNGLTDCDDPACLGTAECGDCHPITNDGCTGSTCYLDYNNDWFGSCTPTSGPGGQGDPCMDQSACQPGYYCSGQYNECLMVCRPESNECAPYGVSCYPFSDFGSTSPWGICL